jgi:hypothetical protein
VHASCRCGWLCLLGPEAAAQIPIVACAEVPGVGRDECAIPEALERAAGSALGHSSSEKPQLTATQLLLEFCARNGRNGAIVCIAPLTPLHVALQEAGEAAAVALRGLGAVYVQAQLAVDAASGTVRPSAEAFNFREDMAAADAVIRVLTTPTPDAGANPILRCLGKHAAYAVGLPRSAVDAIDEAIATQFGGGTENAVPLKLSAIMAETMDVFRRGNPELFYRLYPEVPAQHRDHSVPDPQHAWFGHLTVTSHPYDPLLVLWAWEEWLCSAPPQPASFAPVTIGPTSTVAVVGNDAGDPGVVSMPGDEEPLALQRLVRAMLHAAITIR